MRTLALLLLVALTSLPATAGYYGGADIDTYDGHTGLYYKAVEQKPEERSRFSRGPDSIPTNIHILDPGTGKSVLLFDRPQKQINLFAFESGFKDGSVVFSGPAGPRLAANNTNVPKRELRDKLLIGVRDEAAKLTTLWVSDKRGAALKKLVEVPFAADFHVDVRNSQLRVVHQTGTNVRIDSYPW